MGQISKIALRSDNTIPLSRFETDFTKITVEKDSTVLLISDLHFSDNFDSHFSDPAIKLTIEYLPSLVKKVTPDYIFILGDLIHGTQKLNEFCLDLLDKLDSLGCPVFIIAGSHDRYFYKEIDFTGYKYVRYIDDHFASITFLYNQFQENIVYLTHDGGNNIFLNSDEKKEFLNSLRQTYEIPEKSWLITGNNHFPFVDYETKDASLGCFNFDSFKHHKTVLSFGLLTFKSEAVDFKLLDLGESENLFNSDYIEKKLDDLSA